ncbi:MAG: TetR family transcriptional regulator C-terminal domain-containing protein [Rhizobiales bacterium]|nr:TetR/AcrR family transcriptional regulator [Hyphomicrobiales bacterium]NRB12910.1 TetR family transcriptional regulator C-terminal domain-containing protein [Hyphomicrobiales bacterium]
MNKNTNKKSEKKIRSRNEIKILDAAVLLFSKKGFDGTRFMEIAKASELPKANVYYYFSSKNEIYERLIENVIQGWDNAFEHINLDLEPADAIDTYIGAKLDYARLNPIESRFFAHEMLRGGEFLTRKQRQHIRDVTRKHEHVLESWILQGKIRDISPQHFFIMLWASTEFYANFTNVVELTLEKRKLTKKDYDNARKTIVNSILNGCLKK